ncbi:hypothetical protein PISL3812_01302 [Talaromyces islandicus]|uniref:Uncharacterized protein n=1 Tax=Talaromyces islandicus TaxID=28573 RepID=A0A0U1LNH5_TALIS|nr:hypothetical protein PISL3812_01302 [Talaromyces islandicus]
MATTTDQPVDLQRRFTSATVAPRGVGAGLQSQGLHAESANTPETISAFFRPQDSLDGCAVSANYDYTRALGTSRVHVSASSSSTRPIRPSAVPRFASMIAMDERAAPPSPGARATSKSSTHEHHPILNGITESAMQITATSFAQRLVSKPWKNGHVHQPSSPAKRQIDSQVQPNRGHKRTATGDVKMAVSKTQNQSQANGVNGHSRTMSLDSTGGRIAEVIHHPFFWSCNAIVLILRKQLSAQLRARLSYAAAKVEKNWQGQQAATAPSRLLKLGEMRNTGDLPAGSRPSYNGSPEGTVISAPETSSARASHPNGTSERTRSSMPPRTTSLQPPKLAPPVNIVSANNPHTIRRRPNPNEINGGSSYSSHPRHRRYHSEQEGHPYNSNLSTISVPPFFNSSTLGSNGHAESPMGSSHRSPVKRRTPSQNALMEQDAIETLLFMSSPENSGYRANSRPRQTNVSVSIEAQIESISNGNTQTSTQGGNASNSRNTGANFFNSEAVGALPASFIGSEAQAGDEIDRLLDQMETESRNDTETRLSSYDFTSLGNQELDLYGPSGIKETRD